MVRIYFEPKDDKKPTKFVDIYFWSIIKCYLISVITIIGLTLIIGIIIGMISMAFS